MHIVAFLGKKILLSTKVVSGLPRLKVDWTPTAFSQHGFYRISLPAVPVAVGMILNAQIARESGLKTQHVEKRAKWFASENFIGLWNLNFCLPTLF